VSGGEANCEHRSLRIVCWASHRAVPSRSSAGRARNPLCSGFAGVPRGVGHWPHNEEFGLGWDVLYGVLYDITNSRPPHRECLVSPAPRGPIWDMHPGGVGRDARPMGSRAVGEGRRAPVQGRRSVAVGRG
jgi:hypothetical protein